MWVDLICNSKFKTWRKIGLVKLKNKCENTWGNLCALSSLGWVSLWYFCSERFSREVLSQSPWSILSPFQNLKTSETGMLGSSDYISLTSPLNTCVCVCMHAQSCPTLCELIDCSLPGFSVHGIIPARILEWVTISSSGGSSQPRDQTCSSPCVLWLLHWQEDSLPRATREASLLLWLEATHLRYMLIKLNCI